MKLAGIIVMVLSLGLMSSSFQGGKKVATYEDCFTVTLQTKGQYDKTDPACIEMKWRNDCTTKMDLKYAFEQHNGLWTIGSKDDIAPNEEIGSSCAKATGISRIWARPSSERATILFPTNEEIMSGKAK
ncbi:MAG: hypothetical protein M3R17_19460 [Bacteroidota bacterium]|nr:hypothetical protein [Bacteroidota bacterium]